MCIDNKCICSVYILYEGDWVAIYIFNPVITRFFGFVFFGHHIRQKTLILFIFWPRYVINIYKLVKCLVKFVKSKSSKYFPGNLSVFDNVF